MSAQFFGFQGTGIPACCSIFLLYSRPWSLLPALTPYSVPLYLVRFLMFGENVDQNGALDGDERYLSTGSGWPAAAYSLR